MKALALVLLAAAALGCRPPSTGPVRLGRGAAFALRAPEAGPDFFANQEVVFHKPDGSTETLLTAVENGGGRLAIVASTPLGLTLFTVRVEGGQATVDRRVPLPGPFDPRLLPALVQLANWPLADLRKGLEDGLELTDEGPSRVLRRRGKVILTLLREGAAPPYRTLVLAIPALSLTLDIRTLDETP